MAGPVDHGGLRGPRGRNALQGGQASRSAAAVPQTSMTMQAGRLQAALPAQASPGIPALSDHPSMTPRRGVRIQNRSHPSRLRVGQMARGEKASRTAYCPMQSKRARRPQSQLQRDIQAGKRKRRAEISGKTDPCRIDAGTGIQQVRLALNVPPHAPSWRRTRPGSLRADEPRRAAGGLSASDTCPIRSGRVWLAFKMRKAARAGHGQPRISRSLPTVGNPTDFQANVDWIGIAFSIKAQSRHAKPGQSQAGTRGMHGREAGPRRTE